MAKDYGLQSTPANAQRRRELAQDDNWVREFLAKGQIAHVATRWDQQPFITPTTYWFDPERTELYFHSNQVGRLRANCERHPEVCFAVSEFGNFLPSNVALEFSVQYASVEVYGAVRILSEVDEQRRALNGLLKKYFGHLTSGKQYRPITDEELARTSVYAVSIESWSGKRNWPEQADQSDEWPALPLDVHRMD